MRNKIYDLFYEEIDEEPYEKKYDSKYFVVKATIIAEDQEQAWKLFNSHFNGEIEGTPNYYEGIIDSYTFKDNLNERNFYYDKYVTSPKVLNIYTIKEKNIGDKTMKYEHYEYSNTYGIKVDEDDNSDDSDDEMRG